MKYYLIAGEASGDLHGANLIKEIKLNDPNSIFRFWGGELMQKQSDGLVKHYKYYSFMGFLEVLSNARLILKNIKFCKQDIKLYNPDVIIYIDYPGFNLRIAKWAKQNNYKNYYYISPKIWIWKENRISSIKRDIDKMFVILPFEKKFYSEKHNFKVDYVGNPLLDAVKKETNTSKSITFRYKEFLLKNKLKNLPIIALLPGSRDQEIKKILPVMIRAASKFKAYQLVVAGAPNKEKTYYLSILKNNNIDSGLLNIIIDNTYNLLKYSKIALVTSGTATLETALFKVPQVVCYKTSIISYFIGKVLIKNLKYISLVNLILDKKAVTELIQNDCNVMNLELEIKKILKGKFREEMIEDYNKLENSLGKTGASKKTAKLITESLNI
ncbi:MAG: lipid-A-disaccharide synthase [Flavobacteriaceae bacterium]|nr:lipid-A-disaccharide synthase [Flavobacteriaceae bacterium]